MDLLLVSANSRSDYIDVEREHRILQTLFASNKHSLRVLPAAEIQDLRDSIVANKKSNSFQILHFCGHASVDRGLHLRGKGHRTVYLDAQTLKRWLKNAGVELVVLNACNSEAFASTLSAVVPIVIATTRKIRDIAARGFTRDFYGALAKGMSESAAFELALAKQRTSSSPAYVRIANHA